MTSSAVPPVIGIAGWKNSGKTTLAVRLIEEFTRRGLSVASVKHTHHDVEVEGPETDSARHRRAGASEVVLVGDRRWALLHEVNDAPPPSLRELLPRLAPVSLVIVEGFKSEAIAKIEVRRAAQPDRTPLAPQDPLIIAVAADHQTETGTLPRFALDDVTGLADFIARALNLPGSPSAA